MNNKEAFGVIERLMVFRINKFTIAINSLSEVEVDVTEATQQMKEEREALKVMRELFNDKEKICSWTLIPEGELYQWQYKTSCGAILKHDVDFEYCPACGKKLIINRDENGNEISEPI